MWLDLMSELCMMLYAHVKCEGELRKSHQFIKQSLIFASGKITMTQPAEKQAASTSSAPTQEQTGPEEKKGECPICKMMREGGCEQQFHVSREPCRTWPHGSS